jgi:hypothetical protein
MAEKKEDARKPVTYSETQANTPFSKDYFAERFEYLSHLGKLHQSKLETPESRAEYFTIDPSASTRDTEYALKNLEAMASGESQAMKGFARKNIKDLASLVSEEDGLKLALNAPAIRASGKPDADAEKEKTRSERESKYNAVVSIVEATQEAMNRISKASKDEKLQKEYLAEQMKSMKVDPSSAYGKFLESRIGGILKADMRIAQMRAGQAIKKYGIASYLTQAMSVATQYEKASPEQEEALKKLNDMRVAIEIAADAKAKMEAGKAFDEARNKYESTYKSNINAQQVIELLSGEKMLEAAASAIEEEKAIAKAKEEKK